MAIYTVKYNKEGENISITQGTKLVIHTLQELIYIYTAHPNLYINGKYIFLNTPPQVGECMLQTPNLCCSVKN